MDEYETIKKHLFGCEHLAIAIISCLLRKKIIDHKSILDSLEVIEKYLFVTESETTSIPVKFVREFISASQEACPDTPELLLYFSGSLHADAGVKMRTALKTWLSQATADELDDEFRQALDDLLQRFSDSGNGDEDGK